MHVERLMDTLNSSVLEHKECVAQNGTSCTDRDLRVEIQMLSGDEDTEMTEES